jgi:hypothetical protein
MHSGYGKSSSASLVMRVWEATEYFGFIIPPSTTIQQNIVAGGGAVVDPLL